MNWYKKAKIDNYPLWLAQKIMEETSDYQHLRSKIYPESAFKPQDIQLVEKWIKETNPSFENLNLFEAVREAKIYYHNKKLPPKLDVSDINKSNLILTLLDALSNYDVGELNTRSLVIKSISAVYPDVSKISQQTFNYAVVVEFETDKEKIEKWKARLVTKDGQYFVYSSMEVII